MKLIIAYLLVVGKKNGSVTYFGPFPTEARAKLYATSLPPGNNRWHLAPLVVPFNLVVDVEERK